MYRDEILDAARLPIIWRIHAMLFAAKKCRPGRDVRGIKRGHQFDKVEMVSCTAGDLRDELQTLVEKACEVCRRLGIAISRPSSSARAEIQLRERSDLRYRDVGARPRRWLEVQLVLELHGLSDAARAIYPLSAGERRQDGIPARAQRVGARIAADADRGEWKIISRPRQYRDTGGPAAVHGRR